MVLKEMVTQELTDEKQNKSKEKKEEFKQAGDRLALMDVDE
jgi:hypothetical protein